MSSSSVTEEDLAANIKWALHKLFSQFVCIKLASPQAAQRSKHFFQENQLCCTSVRDLLKDTPMIERETETETEREEKKAQHLAGFEPTTSLS